jgi:FixJ family two-component response regulator
LEGFVKLHPTISIVDDDSWARQGIKDLVASLGYKTLTFSSAEEFIQSGCAEKTACVITDLEMPRCSGLELQEYLARQPHRASVIVVTAYPDEKLREQAIAAGAFGFLPKPFDEKRLVDCLNAALAA